MNRRSFLKMIGAAIGALVLPIPKARKKPKMATLATFGNEWINCGRWPPSPGVLYFVDEHNGDDSNSGLSIDEAFATEQSAFDAASWDEIQAQFSEAYVNSILCGDKS